LRRPRLGFLGVGWIGRNRMEAIARSGAAEVAAITDAAPEVARSVLESVPGARIVPGVAALLEQDLDGVVIATPSALRAEQSVAALRRGMAVFCQKPLGRTEAEVRAVLETARAADRLLAVDLSYRCTRAVQAIRARFGELGEVYAANLVFHNAYGPDKPWFYDVRLAGGGCVMDLGIHLVDLALWLLGGPGVEKVASSLSQKGRRLRGRQAVEDHGAALLELSTGCSLQLACSWRLAAGQDCVIEASFYGSAAGASFRNVNGSFYDFRAELFRGTAREVLVEPPDSWGGRAAVEWATRLATGERFDPHAGELAAVAATIDRIYAGR
jgi:predicted dehydrogenase